MGKTLSLAIAKPKAKPNRKAIQPFVSEYLVAHFLLSFASSSYLLSLANPVNPTYVITSLLFGLLAGRLGGKFVNNSSTSLVALTGLCFLLGSFGFLGALTYAPLALYAAYLGPTITSYPSKVKSVVASCSFGIIAVVIVSFSGTNMMLPTLIAPFAALSMLHTEHFRKGLSLVPVLAFIVAQGHLPEVIISETSLNNIVLGLFCFSFGLLYQLLSLKTEVSKKSGTLLFLFFTLYSSAAITLVHTSPLTAEALSLCVGVVFGLCFALSSRLLASWLLLIGACLTGILACAALYFSADYSLFPSINFLLGVCLAVPVASINWFRGENLNKLLPTQACNLLFLSVIPAAVASGLLIAQTVSL